MDHWIRVATASDCPPGQSREIVADGRIIALFNAAGQFFALDGVCPHQGGPLGKGAVHDHVVTCPWHGWQFDVRTGQHLTSRSVVHPTLPVKLEDDDVFVNLSEAP